MDGDETQAPRRFATWWTIVASILLAALGVSIVAGKRGAGLRTSSTDPLKAFDHMAQLEASDPPLPPAVAADAEHTLKALIADGKQPTEVANGARARLAIVLGETGRWGEAQPYLLWSDHLSLIPVVICAYGRDKACTRLSACDEAKLAAVETIAGPWAARRACKAAALRRGDAAAAAKLDESPVERAQRMKWLHLYRVLSMLLLFAGAIAGVVLVRAHRRSTVAPPSPLPAPWTKGELYAALVRCAVLPLICGILVEAILIGLKVRHRSVLGLSLYLFAWAWVARLVFRRFGLSWTDALVARRTEPGANTGLAALFAIAAIGLDRAGHFAIPYVADAVGIRSPWSDELSPQTVQVSMRLAGVILEIVILAPLIEELVCRRAIFAAFRRRWSFGWAALASAAIFAAPHAYSAVGMSLVVWSGLVTAWAYDRTGSLWPSVLVHASGNALALLAGLI